MIIALPGARAAGAAQYTIELTGSNGTTQSKNLAGGTTAQFDDLAPDTYSISVKGRDDAGTLVFSGTATATVIAGETASVTVELKSSLGNLTVEFTVPAESSAASYTVEITDVNSVTQSKTVSDGTSALFEGLIPGLYSISVMGKNTADDTGTIVLSGTEKATVVEGQTVTATVPLQDKIGKLSVAFTVPDGSNANSFTVEISDSKEFTQSKTVSDGTSALFEGLIPGLYSIRVEGKNTADDTGTIVLSGSATETVVEGQTVIATVPLQEEVGRLSIEFTVPDNSTATSYTVKITHSEDKEFSKEVTIPAGSSVHQFNDLIPGSYTISVQGMNADTVVLYGFATTTNEVGKGEESSVPVSLAGIVNTLDALKAAIPNGGIIYVGSDIVIDATITETPSTPVTIQAAYKDVTLSWTGTTNPMFQPTSGEWTFGGGEHTITLVGGSMSKSIITISATATPKVTLTTNGVININNSYGCGVIISDSATASNGIFCLDGGSITGRAAHSVEVYANGQFIMESGFIEASAEKVVYMYGGAFSMTGGNIHNSSTNASYSSVFVNNGSFTFGGGTISKGVVVSDSDLFTISGSATVDTIKLNTYNIYFTVGGKLEGNSTVATITPGRYQDGEQILKAGSGVDLAAEVGKFKVTPQNGTQWTIDTSGNLQQVTQ